MEHDNIGCRHSGCGCKITQKVMIQQASSGPMPEGRNRWFLLVGASQLAAVGLALLLVPAYTGYAFSEICRYDLNCLFGYDIFFVILLPSYAAIVTSALGAILLLLNRKKGMHLTFVGLVLWGYISFSLMISTPILGGLFMIGTIAMFIEFYIGWVNRNVNVKKSLEDSTGHT